MKKFIPLLALALIVAPATSFAAKADGPKARAMAQFDADKDGKLNAAETAAIRESFSKQPEGDLKRFDTNKDGKLSDDEIAQMIPGSGKKSDDKKSDGKKSDKADSKKGEKKSGGKSGGEKKKSTEKPAKS